MAASTMLRGVSALRLSVLTDETTSPERQREANARVAADLGIDLGDREAVDPGVSASKTTPFERPELGRGWPVRRSTAIRTCPLDVFRRAAEGRAIGCNPIDTGRGHEVAFPRDHPEHARQRVSDHLAGRGQSYSA
ncbi:hypothetical protein TPA0910_31980 [Streptomyces hygroscopicus subsp. sporocinereus]|uniref:Uncharacterized protein n=1 Tax=Streptomyces hygroscopicus TaxID=1912 RepID=A0ABQ3TZI8_STRHY|nr:hypothetical protein TPA0910_31980 [Streptomyces hygroscopicus]